MNTKKIKLKNYFIIYNCIPVYFIAVEVPFTVSSISMNQRLIKAKTPTFSYYTDIFKFGDTYTNF